MIKPVIECPTCGATITAEEISAGKSLICPKCEEAQEASKSNPAPTHHEERSPSPSLRPHPGGSCCCGHGGGCG